MDLYIFVISDFTKRSELLKIYDLSTFISFESINVTSVLPVNFQRCVLTSANID